MGVPPVPRGSGLRSGMSIISLTEVACFSYSTILIMEKFTDSLLKSKKSNKIQLGKDKKKDDTPDMAVCCPCKFTLKQRIIGFVICYAIALVIDIASFLALFKMLTGHPEKFAIAYSLGNIIAFVG